MLRQLVPGMSDKTDKATVFEFAARYVHFLKSHTGAQYDKVSLRLNCYRTQKSQFKFICKMLTEFKFRDKYWMPDFLSPASL